MKYKRQLKDNGKEAERLYKLGYRQTSYKFRCVARVEVPDLVSALKERQPFSSCEKWKRWEQEDYWRRCCSQDKLDEVDTDVMRLLRSMAKYDDTTGALVLRCVENRGVEDGFDKGVEYVASMERDGMWLVFDKYGEMRECLMERFERIA